MNVMGPSGPGADAICVTGEAWRFAHSPAPAAQNPLASLGFCDRSCERERPQSPNGTALALEARP